MNNTDRQQSSVGAGPSDLLDAGDEAEPAFTLVNLLSPEEAEQLQEQERRLQVIVEKLQDPDSRDVEGNLLSDADRAILRDIGVQVGMHRGQAGQGPRHCSLCHLATYTCLDA